LGQLTREGVNDAPFFSGTQGQWLSLIKKKIGEQLSFHNALAQGCGEIG
jgi:hypothetical protein